MPDEQSIVSLLEERVELAISTVQQLRTEKLELEAEVARLNSDLLQRDAQIQDLEDRNSGLTEELDSERTATRAERSEIRERLEDLMAVLTASDEDAENTEDEIDFEVEHDESDLEAIESDSEAVEAEQPVVRRGFAGI